MKASQRVDPDDDDNLQHWCEHFGATAEQIAEAVKAVGAEPAAVHEHLMNQGSSAGAG